MPRTSGAPRRFISAFNLQVGPISLVGSLTPLVATEARQVTSFPYTCPECEPVVSVSQGYTCDQGHGPYTSADLARSRELPDGSWAKLSEEEYIAVRGSDLEANKLRVTVHPADQVQLVPHGTAYRFEPPTADTTFAALIELVSSSDKAFIGVCNLRGHEGLFQVFARNGGLEIHKMTWPESLNQFEAVNVEPDEAIVGAAKGMLDRISTDFDPGNYRSTQIARARELTAALAGQQPETPAETAATSAQAQSREEILAALATFAA